MRIRWMPWVGASVLGLLFTGCTSSLKTESSRLSGSAPDIAIRAEDLLLTGCRDALLAHAAYLETLLPKMALSADQVAKRLMEGGSLYVAGERSFISEASGRAGGMRGATLAQINVAAERTEPRRLCHYAETTHLLAVIVRNSITKGHYHAYRSQNQIL